MKPTEFNSKFPKHFLWGAATSAHQVEGGNYNQWTVWELENAKVKSAQAEYQYDDLDSWTQIEKEAKSPNNYVSGKLANHYRDFEQDFDFLQKMHMNAYRFSLEWSRIEPERGRFDPKAIAHYKDYIFELKRRNIEPIMTLFHFTLPVWFAEMGGFEKRSNIKYFVRYAKKVMGEFGTNVKFIITINEPELYARQSYYTQEWPPMQSSAFKFLVVTHNLARVHCQVAKAIHKMGRQYRVSIAKNTAYYYPGDNSIVSRISFAVMQYFSDDYIIKKYINNCDFLGVNFYQSNRVFGCRIHNSELRQSDVGWYMDPASLEFALERLYGKYKKPIIVTENGLADATDKNRKWWITETIIAMQNAIKNGVKLQGYLHWSLMDNFEWAYGKWPRFGLVQVNYKTGERELRPSAQWFGRIIKKIRNI